MPKLRVEIKSRWTAQVLFSTEVEAENEREAMKPAMEKAVEGGAYLRGADLHGADLRGADLHGANLHGADLHGAYLHGAYLHGADLHGADLRGADLHGADLDGADLHGAKNYQNSHDLAIEVIRRQEIEAFTSAEWSIIGQISIHRPCWPDIKRMFGDAVISILDKLADLGFGEYKERFEKESP